MTARKLETLYTGGSFFEGPRWRGGHWYVSDFFRHRVLRIAPNGKAETFLEVAEQPSGLGWLPDGSLLAASMRDKKLLRKWPDGKVTVHADIGAFCGGWLNDIVVDGIGRAWCGNFGFDLMQGAPRKPANLVRVDPDGKAEIATDDLQFPNGSVVTPDNTTLIVGESMASRYTAFTIGADGTLSNRRVWAAAPDMNPDGCCLDAQGRIWSAEPQHRRVRLIAEGGTIIDEIAMPSPATAIACMLGGEDGRTLLIACLPELALQGRENKTDAYLATARVDIPRAGYP